MSRPLVVSLVLILVACGDRLPSNVQKPTCPDDAVLKTIKNIEGARSQARITYKAVCTDVETGQAHGPVRLYNEHGDLLSDKLFNHGEDLGEVTDINMLAQLRRQPCAKRVKGVEGSEAVVGTPIQMRAFLMGGKFAAAVTLCAGYFGPEAYDNAASLSDAP